MEVRDKVFGYVTGEVKLGEQQKCSEGLEGSGGHCVSSCQL